MLEFLTRRGCHLCEDALRMVRAAGVEVTVVDIDLDLDLLAAFDHRVPVVRDPLSGAVFAEGRISVSDLAAITAGEATTEGIGGTPGVPS